jgi:glutathione synthase/RimK-type ligase-like ATP-grasp enzyme
VILVVSHARDEHLPPVLAALRRRRARTALLDLSRFPAAGRLSLRFGGGRGEVDGAIDAEGGPVRPSDIRAVWWRRPQPFEAGPELRHPTHRRFALRETEEAFAGLWEALRPGVRWVNHPVRDRAAGHKPGQLALAIRLGLDVPRTLVTSDPAAARRFLAEVAPGRVVCKALSSSAEAWLETRVVDRAARRLLPLLRHAPAILQEEVAGVDLRVTAVGSRLFTAEIDARGTRYPGDFRLDPERAALRRARLPREVAAALRAMMRALGLSYAAFDLRRTPQGEHRFLEVNPGGQWLFVERRSGLPIAEALAALLAGE